MKIAWSLAVPATRAAVEAPPVPSLIDHYVLGFDEAREATFYLCPRDDDQRGAELWIYDGTSWSKPMAKRFERQDGKIEGGGWDSARRGVVMWTFAHDYTTKQTRPVGYIADASGPRKLETTGDLPVPEVEGGERIGTFDKRGAFAFDRAREVWVCVTRCGVWELDATGAWAKKGGATGIPQEWHSSSGTGVYDPVAKRCVFSVQGRGNGYPVLLFAWDGTAVSAIDTKGLPKPHVGLFKPAMQIAGHGRHGLVVQIGAQLFAFGEARWRELPAASGAPPKMERALLSWDPKLDALVLGPGKHEGAGGSEYQRVFFVLRGDAWERHGSVVKHSALKGASYGNCRLAHVGGVWYGTGTHSLRTWKWNAPNWDEIVDKEVGEKIGGWEILSLIALDRLHAVTQSGAVFVFDGAKWNVVRKADPAFKKRTDFAMSQDGTGRIVVWGGEANGRKLNDTLFLEGGKWRAAKKPSPQPADFKHGNKDSVWVGTTMVWDSALGALVRFGFEEVFLLGPDEVWSVAKVKSYKSLISERAYGHAPFHDPTTGETLLVDFENARVVRFDLGGCVEVATFEYPAAIAPKRPHDAAAYHALAQSFSWDPTTRSLFAQVLEDEGGVFRLDLGPVFERAKSLGPRKLDGLAKASAPKTEGPTFEATRLYRIQKGKASFVAFAPEKNKVAVTSGVVFAKGDKKVVAADAATKLVAAKRKEGFRRATELPREALVALAGVPSSEIDVGKAIKSGTLPKSRLGGTPSLVSGKAWPRAGKKPMGFLFQIETGSLLKKHAGVAVFCSLDGEATTDDSENAVVLLRAADFAKKGELPAGVPELPPRALVIDEAKIEIDEERAHDLGERDPEMLAALEALQTKKGMQKSNLAMKLGGIPQFLQDEIPVKGHTFVAQLDFDGIDVSKAWPDAGLAGCVYVFVKDDEKDAFAIWQYT